MARSRNDAGARMPQGWMHLVPRDWWPWLMVAAGVIALAALVGLIRIVMRRRGARSEAGARVTLSQQRALERDITALLRDLSDMARQVGSQLDARAVRLEELIQDADERLERLDDALRAVQQRTQMMPAPAPASSSAPASAPSSASSPLGMHPALLPVEGARGDERGERAVEGAGDRSDARQVDARHLEIYTLADQGLAMQDIAQRLRRPNGEIELILALRPQGSRPARS